MKRLVGKHAIVTGSGSGIGEAIADLFVKEGATVLAVDKEFSSTAEDQVDSPSVRRLQIDVTDLGAAEAIVEKALSEFGGVDVLVNNAGICIGAKLEDMEAEVWNKILAVNLDFVYKLTQSAIPALKNSRCARIINMGSIMSSVGMDNLTAYTVSKHGIAALTKCSALELGGYGITANYIMPGPIVTAITQPMFDEDENYRNFWVNKSPLGRVGVPEDVANIALFLASPESSYVTGHGLVVDGGATISP